MIKRIQLKINTKDINNEQFILNKISEKVQVKKTDINSIILKKKAIDSRNKKIKYHLEFEVFTMESHYKRKIIKKKYNQVSKNKLVIIIGMGSAGLFAALKLIELGLKPIIYERGKKVRERRRDIANLTKKHKLNENSNYCFGEGGAGTFSDGKLYTRSKKRGDVKAILETLVFHGAEKNILFDNHPHIGTDKLPKIIQNIRQTIIKHGGEIHFNSKVDNLIIKENKICGIVVNKTKHIKCHNVILASGHSARDIYYMLNRNKIKLELKEIAVGVRVEHEQELINKIQYHNSYNKNYLPPATYNISTKINGRSVHSFCMCPGGIIAPCATKNGELVTNGWSPSRRDNKNANSGIVVQLNKNDFDTKKYSEFASLEFQKKIEEKAFSFSNNTQKIPAQRITDFIADKVSNNIPKTSYLPGTISVKLSDLFPKFIFETLREAFLDFEKKMSGFINKKAIVHAPETRTSSPIRIPRNNATLENEQIDGLFPCGEGAGYAGGIMSAAIDGEKVAIMVNQKMFK